MIENAVVLIAAIAIALGIVLILSVVAASVGSSLSQTRKGWVKKKFELPNLWFYLVPIGSKLDFPVFKYFSKHRKYILLLDEGGQYEYWLVSKLHWEDTRKGGYYITQSGDMPLLIEADQAR